MVKIERKVNVYKDNSKNKLDFTGKTFGMYTNPDNEAVFLIEKENGQIVEEYVFLCNFNNEEA